MKDHKNLAAFLAGTDFGYCLDCGGLLVPDAFTDTPACVVCSGNPDLVPVTPPEHEGEKGFSFGYRSAQSRGARVIEEWDAAAYEREYPLRGEG